MKILVLGATGVVGFHLAAQLEKKHEVVRVTRSAGKNIIQADVSTDEGMEKALSCHPDVVVNAVKPALSVDEMERERQAAYEINTRLPERLSHEQARKGFKLVQISTDGVYEGVRGEVYTEDSLVYPPNYYCLTKALAEERIAGIANDYLILRTEGVFGHDGRGANFFMRMAAAEKNGSAFSASSDQFSQPICALALANTIETLVEGGRQGVYNCCGPDLVSRHQLAGMIKQEMGWKLEVAESSILGRGIKVQPHLQVSIAKVEGAAGRMPPLGEQIGSLKRWLDENRDV